MIKKIITWSVTGALLVVFSMLAAVSRPARADVPEPPLQAGLDGVEPARSAAPAVMAACSAQPASYRTTLTAIQDSYISSASPDANYGTGVSLQVGRTTTPISVTYRALAAFDLAALPSDAVILTATLQVYQTSGSGFDIKAQALTAAWSESAVTWNNQPAFTTQDEVLESSPDGSWRRWNLTPIVQKWRAGALANNGVRLIFNFGTAGSRYFSAREGANPPRLVVEYVRRTPALYVQADTQVSQANPSLPCGNCTPLYIARSDTSPNYEKHALLQFDVSSVPAGSTIISASLGLFPYFAMGQAQSPTAPQALDIVPEAALAAWNEATVTWNTAPASAGQGDPALTWADTMWWNWFDVTNIVRGWNSGVLNNYGIKLKPAVGFTGSAPFEAIPNTNRARLIITYGPPPCYAAASVTIGGATQGVTGTQYAFNASILPVTATLPITYTWQATGQSAVSGPQSAVTYTWATTGTKTITVTASNCDSSVADTHQIVINAPAPACPVPLTGLSVSGPTQGVVDMAYTFTAQATPSGATKPVVYTWEADEQPPSSGGQVIKSYTWTSPGMKHITATVQNCGGTFVQHHWISVQLRSDLTVSGVWYNQAEERVYYVLKNVGGGTAPAGHTAQLSRDGSSVASASFNEALAPGALRAGSIPYAWTCAGATAQMRVCADATGILPESNEANNCFEQTWSCDLVPPQITAGPTVSGITEHNAAVAWTTSEPCRSRVDYGRNGPFNVSSISDNTLKTNHQATLSGLESGGLYWYNVVITDAAGNLNSSGGRFFQTQPPGSDPPQIASIGMVEYPSSMYEFYILQATLTETQYVDRVSFFLDGQLIGKDYTPNGKLYEVYLSPAALGLTRANWFKAHTLQVQAYNLQGAATPKTATVTPASRQMTTRTYIQKIAPSNTVYIGGSTAPAGTTMTVTVWAAEYRWGCYSEAMETPPPGLEAVACEDVRQDVSMMSLYLDGTQVGVYAPPAGVLTRDFVVDLGGKGLGAHTLKARATASDGTLFDREKTFNIVSGVMCVDVTRQVNRVGNYYQVSLTLKNTCDTAIHLDALSDRGLVGLQAANKAFGLTYSLATTYVAATQRGSVEIDLFDGAQTKLTLNPGAQHSLQYVAVPVLRDQELPGNDLSYSIGYESSGSVTYTVGTDPTKVGGFFYKPWTDSVAAALKTADYVLVTNPTRLFSQVSGDRNAVLAHMAYLAYLKNGVLGYLTNYDDGSTLDALIGSNGGWTRQLHPNFAEYHAKGYVLIVGEDKIVPNLGAGYTVPYSDLRYASTSGEAKPELVLGRIVGNNAAALNTALKNSIGVYEGWPGYSFDRARALVSSGRGEGEATFWDHAKEIASRLNHASVTRLRWKNYAVRDDMLNAFKNAMALGQGLVVYRGHAGATAWGDGGAIELYTTDLPNLNFNGYRPFVFALACDSGNYSGTTSMAETFLEYGAAVYIGAVSPSDRGTNGRAGRAFFNRWGNNNAMGVGYAFVDMARDHWADDSNWKEWIYQYHLFGDPKFGALPLAAAAATAEAQLAAGSASLQVYIPDYEVFVGEDGLDYVSIPGGSTWLGEGEYQVPYWKTAYTYPAGQRVQAVALTAQAGLVVTSGLRIPTATLATDCGCAAPARALVVTDTGWAPDVPQPYRWTTFENADGSTTLELFIYPFYYNPATTDARFYKEFSFEVETISSTVEIESLHTSQASYRPGDVVSIHSVLSNSGNAQDVVVSAVIKSLSDETVAGLPLRMLRAFTETALVSLEWNSSGFAPGAYYVELELRDSAGNVLDSEIREFQLSAPIRNIYLPLVLRNAS